MSLVSFVRVKSSENPSLTCELSCQKEKKISVDLIISALALGVIATVAGLLLLAGELPLNAYVTMTVWATFLTSFILNGLVIVYIAMYSKRKIDPDQRASTFVLNNITRLDPSDPENALKILNVPENRKQDLAFINSQRDQVVNFYRKKQEHLPEAWFAVFEALIGDVQAAYETLAKAAN